MKPRAGPEFIHKVHSLKELIHFLNFSFQNTHLEALHVGVVHEQIIELLSFQLDDE